MQDLKPSSDARAKPDLWLKRYWRVLVAAAGVVALVAGVITQSQQVFDAGIRWFGKPEDNVRVGWLTVDDPRTLDQCVLRNSSTFELVKGQGVVAIAPNECEKELRRMTADLATASERPQIFTKSYFLLIENRGPDIESLSLFDNKAREIPLSKYSSVNNGTRIAICVGYDGRSGYPSRMDQVDVVEVKRNRDGRIEKNVPAIGSSSQIGASDCGIGINWAYPN